MTASELVDRLREIAQIGIVNHRRDVPVIKEAADRLEELDERVDIMLEGNGYSGKDRDIPMKPVKKPGLYGFYCPVCKCRINPLNPDYYCRKCGKAILWDGPKEWPDQEESK